jgi:hypothetical protein
VIEISHAEAASRQTGDELVENYALEAAYNLQILYYSAGNVDMAQRVTQEALIL